MLKKPRRFSRTSPASAIRTACVASVSDEIQEQTCAQVTEWDCGTWCVAGEDDDMLPWEIVSATVVHEPVEQALFLGARGQVFCMGSGDIHEEQLPDGDDAIGGRGNMRGVACIDGVAYACGMDRQVYRRFDENDWRAIDTGAHLRQAAKRWSDSRPSAASVPGKSMPSAGTGRSGSMTASAGSPGEPDELDPDGDLLRGRWLGLRLWTGGNAAAWTQRPLGDHRPGRCR